MPWKEDERCAPPVVVNAGLNPAHGHLRLDRVPGSKMGNPIHYSLELPQRCLQLIDELWPAVQRSRQRDRPDLGSLSTTFLISMSMPIINLPVERLERHKNSTSDGYVDDRHIDTKVSAAVEQVLGGYELKRAPFFVQGEWRFTTRTTPPLPNIARGLPDAIASQLSTDEAATRASKMPTSQWCGILRNAMAHGGIAYLDKNGRSTYGDPVEMLLFASGKFNTDGKLIAVNLLRISESDYRAFLGRWVGWLVASGVAGQLAA